MKILWLTVDRSQRVAKHFDDFRRAAKKVADVTVVKKHLKFSGGGRRMWTASKGLAEGTLAVEDLVLDHLATDSNYDYIFCDAFFAYMYEPWNEFPIPSGIFIEDVHGGTPKKQVDRAGELGVKTIFHRFNFPFHKFHCDAKIEHRCIWLPHSVNMERFTDQVEKDKDVLHTGVYNQQFYPHRYEVIELLRDKSYFTYIARPSDRLKEKRSEHWPIDRDYDNLLQSARICITGGALYGAPVQKFVEIPAANSLLMSNWFPDLGLMGFRDGYNMVAYSKENVVDKVEDLLNNEDKIEEISKKGFDLVVERHTSEIRARQFVNFICIILGREVEFPGIEPCSFQVSFEGKHVEPVPIVGSMFSRLVREPKPKPRLEPKPKPRTGSRAKFLRGLKGTAPGTDWRARIAAGG